MKNLRIYLVLFIAVLLCAVAPVSLTAHADTERVYVGGFPVGISIDVGGLMVESVTGVETEYGTVYNSAIRRGDIIKRINGTDVTAVEDVSTLFDGREAELEVVRGGDTIKISVTPLVDRYSKKQKLGVRIKDKIYGIGTVTFIRENGDFAALGHEIYDPDTDTHIPFCSGKLHACRILGVKKGEHGEAGALLGSLSAESDNGDITCNNAFGIAGRYTAEHDRRELLPVADRTEVKPGAARIKTTVGNKPEYYDIEIIKAMHRPGRREKSLVFRVTDRRLLELTGGVVRGMSGSPIIQDGKLIGAVTHVFLNDFTKGYGVYADCLN